MSDTTTSDRPKAQPLKLKEGMNQALADDLMGDYAQAGSSSNKEVFKLPEDNRQYQVRLLPGTYGKSKQIPWVRHVQHWAPDPTGKSKFNKSFTCPANQDTTHPSSCPFCDARETYRGVERDLKDQLRAADDEKRKKLERAMDRASKIIRALSYRQAFPMCVVPIEDRPLKTRVFYAPKSVFDRILSYYAQEPTIVDPTGGHNFLIKRYKKSGRTTYDTDLEVAVSDIGTQEEIDRLLDARVDLHAEIVYEPDEDVLRRACAALIDEIKNDSKGSTREYGARQQEDPMPSSGTNASIGDLPDDDDDLPGLSDEEPVEPKAEPAKAEPAKAAPVVELDERPGDEADPLEPAKAEPAPKAEPAKTDKTTAAMQALAMLEGDDI